LQTYDVRKLGGFGQEVERGHSRYRDNRQIRHAFAHGPDQVEPVGAPQEDIDNGEIETGILERPQCDRSTAGLDDFEMVDPQHDADHRAHIGLVVDNENAGHQTLSGPDL
jgi:hypothetical protein